MKSANTIDLADQQIEVVDDSTHVGDNERTVIQALSPEEFQDAEKRLKRKLDLRLMATITFTYTLNFLDRNNIAAAKVIGMEKTLGMTSTEFSTAVSLLFVGYILMQVPSNIFLAQLRPSIYLPACMMLWGVLSTCTGAIQHANGLYAIRFLLGFVEAAFFPGSVFLIGCWYKRSEAGIRCAILYSGALVGSACSGLIGAGIHYGLDGALGLESWRWIFIIEGSVTVTVALCAVFILPNYAGNTKWLSPLEQALAQHRLTQDAGNVTDETEPWSYGFKSAFADWRTFAFAAIFHCILVTTSTQNFFPSVVQTLGFGQIQTLLLTVPPYAVAIITSVTNNWSADRLQNSSFHIMWPLAISAIGCALGAVTLNIGARYFAMILMVAGGHSANAVAISWAQKTILRPRIKRAAVVAFVSACGNAAQIWTPYLYPNHAAPRYVLAMSVNAGFAVGGILLVLFMRIVLMRANRRLVGDHSLEDFVEQGETIKDAGQLGATSSLRQRDTFKYVT